MTTKVVKNITEQDLTIVDVGVVKAGETVTVQDDFNNPNFETVSAKKETKDETKGDVEKPKK